MRKKGLHVPALTKLGTPGDYPRPPFFIDCMYD
jgi:hypothetical protein